MQQQRKPSRLVRGCSLGREGTEIEIYGGSDPYRCRWIVVVRSYAGPPASPVIHVANFLDPEGVWLDDVQRDSLREALDSAQIFAGVGTLTWTPCCLVLDDDALPNAVELEALFPDGNSG